MADEKITGTPEPGVITKEFIRELLKNPISISIARFIVDDLNSYSCREWNTTDIPDQVIDLYFEQYNED